MKLKTRDHVTLANDSSTNGQASPRSMPDCQLHFPRRAPRPQVSPHKLAEINPRLRNIRVGSFSYVPNDLKLGCLSGNEFHLLMRAVTGATVEQVGGRL